MKTVAGKHQFCIQDSQSVFKNAFLCARQQVTAIHVEGGGLILCECHYQCYMTSLILIVGLGLSQFGYLQSSFVKFSLQSHGCILDSRHPESTWGPGLEVCLVWPL